ncbi:cell division trigger factor [gamma proteobacterium BDW918]|nr:cell division trigger factor [gamma proteobacterium BDW918]
MEEWAVVQRHIAEEITLLCDQHHREKTGGLLPKQQVEAANKSPYNLRADTSKPYNLHFSGNKACVEIGSNSFTCEDQGYGTAMAPISVDGTPLIGLILADGHFLLNIVIFDEYNCPVLQIKNNQLFYSTSPWDIQLVGTTLTIREAHRKILIEIDFQPPNKVIIKKGRFLRNGVEILVRPQNILITNTLTYLSGNHAHNCTGGLVIGYHEHPIGGFIALNGVPRYLGDKSEALKFEAECKIDNEYYAASNACENIQPAAQEKSIISD